MVKGWQQGAKKRDEIRELVKVAVAQTLFNDIVEAKARGEAVTIRLVNGPGVVVA